MMNLIENELKKKENTIKTENGAIGYKTSNSALVDLNYQVSSLRNATKEEIIALFDKAYYEDKKYTLKWLFFARDIQEGMGERRLFRICYKRFMELDNRLASINLYNITKYGRWDDLVSLIGEDSYFDYTITSIIKTQLKEDLNNLKENKPISLLGKWLPSENASSKETKALAKKVRKLLEMTPREYRLMLSKLRKYLNVVEVNACAKKWDEIDYERVPSLANLKYKDAFLKNDYERRVEYLNSVKKGEKKLNMKVSTPVDIVSRYTSDLFRKTKEYDETLELAWKNLKDIFIENTLVVADGSGSMLIPVGGRTTALDVANALAIYTSEHNKGVYKNKYITFSSSPQFVTFKDDNTLEEKLQIAFEHNEVSNTNIEKVFKLILDIAVVNKVSKDDMIKNVLIISDMEFDRAQDTYMKDGLTRSLFEEIGKKYEMAGYKLPKLIFWNVNSRTKAIPLTENELGVTLISGFSQNVLKMVMSNKYNPYEVLIEMLDSERYYGIVNE